MEYFLKEKKNPKVELLECTLRDGSYAVDFRFTETDTAVLTGELARLGFRYIEIGHGLGVNASNAAKGAMASTDEAILKAAQKTRGDAQLGMFCIPDVAKLEDIDRMADAGLDFIRIGNNAESIKSAFPFLERARKRGLCTMVNFMKSYAISPAEFADGARGTVEHGAEVVYIVDSAGGMLPDEVASYVEAAKKVTDAPLGFHGHNNLHLATACALAAIAKGAMFIDTTIYGLGRSAGNVPTEVLVGILQREGMDLGIDLFDLMNFAEKTIAPLAQRVKMYGMTSVAMGVGKFHSAFFPLVKRIAEEYGVDVKRLIYSLGLEDSSKVKEERAREVAKTLQRSDQGEGYDPTAFYNPNMAVSALSSTVRSVEDLMEELLNAAAKGQRKICVEVRPAAVAREDLVLAEYLTADNNFVVGRVRFGSLDVLGKVADILRRYNVDIIVDRPQEGSWAALKNIRTVLTEHGCSDPLTVAVSEWTSHYELSVMKALVDENNAARLFVYGGGQEWASLQDACVAIFHDVVWFAPGSVAAKGHPKVRRVKTFEDGQEADVVLVLSRPAAEHAVLIKKMAGNAGRIVLSSVCGKIEWDSGEGRVVMLDECGAYSGMLERSFRVHQLIRGGK